MLNINHIKPNDRLIVSLDCNLEEVEPDQMIALKEQYEEAGIKALIKTNDMEFNILRIEDLEQSLPDGAIDLLKDETEEDEKTEETTKRQKIITDLRKISDSCEGKLRIKDYKNNKDEDMYSVGYINKKFGSWNNAKEAAGLETIKRGTSSAKQEPPIEQVKIEFCEDCLENSGCDIHIDDCHYWKSNNLG